MMPPGSATGGGGGSAPPAVGGSHAADMGVDAAACARARWGWAVVCRPGRRQRRSRREHDWRSRPSEWTAEEVSTLDQLQGQFSNLRVRKLIDEGASSQVWEGDWAGARVVIKVLREQEALRSFLSEVNIWRQLRHPCVCALLGVCMFEGRPRWSSST